jgi:hypothetical protein
MERPDRRSRHRHSLIVDCRDASLGPHGGSDVFPLEAARSLSVLGLFTIGLDINMKDKNDLLVFGNALIWGFDQVADGGMFCADENVIALN